MITEIKSPAVTTYYLARSKDGAVHHHGVLDKGLYMATGQPTVEQFADERLFLADLGKYREVTSPEFIAALAAEVAWAKDVASRQPGGKP